MVKNKLAGWKASQLSFAGRITLSKSVIEALPLCAMMASVIPKGCLDEIQRLQRRFIWGEEGNNHKYHVVSWNTVTKPKTAGGLGTRNLKQMNVACVLKLAWSLLQCDDKLWCDVLWGKYERDGPLQDGILVKANDSSLWKCIAANWDIMLDNIFWSIGNGSSISVWDDSWIASSLKLRNVVQMIPNELTQLRVADLVDINESWNLNDIANLIPMEVLNQIITLLPPSWENGPDLNLWPGNAHGEFTVSTAYSLIVGRWEDENFTSWKRLWKCEVPERVRSFLWIMVHDRLLTKLIRHRMGIGDEYCDHCSVDVESSIHVLLTLNNSQQI